MRTHGASVDLGTWGGGIIIVSVGLFIFFKIKLTNHAITKDPHHGKATISRCTTSTHKAFTKQREWWNTQTIVPNTKQIKINYTMYIVFNSKCLYKKNLVPSAQGKP